MPLPPLLCSSPHPLGSSWSLFAISIAFSLIGPQPVQLHGVIQLLCLPSLNFMRFLTTHFSSLSSNKNTQEAGILFTPPTPPPYFGIICKLTECTLSPRLLINMLSGIATGIATLWTITSKWLPVGLLTSDHCSSSHTAHPIFYPPYHALSQSISYSFACMNIMGDHVKGMLKSRCSICTTLTLQTQLDVSS